MRRWRRWDLIGRKTPSDEKWRVSEFRLVLGDSESRIRKKGK